MFLRIGYSLSVPVDIRYEFEKEDGDEEWMDFSEWSTKYTRLGRPSDSPVDADKLLDVLEYLAEKLSGQCIPNNDATGFAAQLVVPATTSANLNDWLHGALYPMGFELDRALIGGADLAAKIEAKGGDVKAIHVDFVIPAEGLTLDRDGYIRDLKDGELEKQERRDQKRARIDAEIKHIREHRKDDMLAELETRSLEKAAAVELSAERAALAEAETEIERLRAELAKTQGQELSVDQAAAERAREKRNAARRERYRLAKEEAARITPKRASQKPSAPTKTRAKEEAERREARNAARRERYRLAKEEAARIAKRDEVRRAARRERYRLAKEEAARAAAKAAKTRKRPAKKARK